jgi:taurine dioxygenase
MKQAATPAEVRGFEVVPLSEHLGAEIRGLDISRPLSPSVAEALKRAFYEHAVLVFRGQTLVPEQHLAFGRVFGNTEPHVALKYRHPEYPDLTYLTNVRPDGSVDPLGVTRAGSWHTDGSFMKVPSAIGILYSLEVPSSGGDTLFSSTCAAYEALSAEMKERIASLRAIHLYGAGPLSKGSNVPLTKEQEGLYPAVEHPIVRTHPITGRKALYVNPQHGCGIVGMDQDSAMELLADLLDHATAPEFQYRHRWQRGDVVMWDQAATLHRAGGGYPAGERRIMMRTIVGGAAAPV